MDIKEKYQLKAEELAQEIYGVDFYSLSEEIRLTIFNDAIRQVNEDLMDRADVLRKEIR